jgi:hypothetical protein
VKNIIILTLFTASMMVVSCRKDKVQKTTPVEIRNGGIVVYEKDGHGLVVTPDDLDYQLDWKSAKVACDSLVLNSYSDWHLPTKDEMKDVYINLNKAGSHASIDGCYWTSTPAQGGFGHWTQYFHDGTQLEDPYDGNRYFVRAVRLF